MKKLIYVFSILFAAILISGCNKEKTEKVADQTVATTVDETGKEKAINLIPSVLFYDEGSLWYENADGALEWYITLNVGQTLYAYPASADSENDVVEAQKMNKAGKKDQDTYIKVLYDNNDYWILSDLVVADAKAAVVIEDTMNYSKDSIDGLSSKAAKVPVGKLIAIHNDYTCPADSDIDFVKVTWRNGSERSYREVFLKSSTVSTSVNDITAMRVNNKAASLKDPVVIMEIVSNVLSLSLTQSIEDIIINNPIFNDYIL